jgi:peroxiredoxin
VSTHDLSQPPAAARRWLTPVGVVLAAGSVVLACYLAVVGFTPGRPPATQSEADAAKEYLRGRKAEPLSGPLQTLLADAAKPRVPTQPHPLLGHPAPAFGLPDVDGQPASLEGFLARGPVVLVFYYGYSCNHCVSQLFDLNEDLKYFRELGATVVAVGPDAPERTRAKYAEFGAFGYPVLSDADRHVAARYGLYRPKLGEAKEWQAHGTFVLDRRGVIRWANTGDEPFTGNVTLLAEFARLENRSTQPNP